MPCSVTTDDILSLSADAVVLSLEMSQHITEGKACGRLAEAGGQALQAALAQQKYIPVGSAAVIEACGLPFSGILLTAVPRWLTGKANELLVLRRCYESVYALAGERGFHSIASPFLSAGYYRFPPKEAVHIALSEAERRPEIRTLFAADTPELAALSREPYRRPAIVSYVGYYRDHAIFQLDNGLYARVDLRPERESVDVIPYFEACYRAGNNPLQPPLAPAEIARLREIYETYPW